MQLNGLKLSGALEELSIALQLLGSKLPKKKKKKKNKGFECSLISPFNSCSFKTGVRFRF